MDISTLSRQLNMSVHELRDQMKQAGFRLSPRARKVDNNLAKEIIRKLSQKSQEAPPPIKSGPSKIQVPAFLTVRDLAAKLELPVTEVIKKLIQNGIMATINEEIDAETAAIIASEFGAETENASPDESDNTRIGMGYVSELLKQEKAENLRPRPPIVAVMGHVDHGKTTLLDTIRKTDVVATEAGAITQHIGAYQIQHEGKLITFLDTPGHEAFAAMRARGANVTDIIVLVVAADDSVKPQTAEVINRAKLTKTPLIVAINKTDKPDSNPERVKGDLASLGVTVEDWGGKIPAVPISAKTGANIDKLLEIILLSSEMEGFQANPEGTVLGAVIESHLSRGQGPVATALVQNGTLRLGDPVVAGTAFGKVRTMEDAAGKRLKSGPPGTPVQISGLSEMPEVGDILQALPSFEEAKRLALSLQKQERVKRLHRQQTQIKTDPNQKELKLVIRADVQGSLEAILDALRKLMNEEVKLTIVSQGAGEINESDVQLAENTGSVIVGFHTHITAAAAKLAKQKLVTIEQYDIIYELVETVTSALLSMMSVKIEEIQLGRARVKALFRTEKEKNQMIVGGEVLEGKIADKKKFRIRREKEIVGDGKIEELQQNRVEVDEVRTGLEFGIKAKTSIPIQSGDILEIFDETVKKGELGSAQQK